MIEIMLFAGLREQLNRDVIHCEQSELTVAQLKHWLRSTYPELSEELERSMVAVNEEFADENTPIVSGDQVALIPPVSGG